MIYNLAKSNGRSILSHISARSYVQDGLVFHFDILNAKSYDSFDSPIADGNIYWKNLVGEEIISANKTAVMGDNMLSIGAYNLSFNSSRIENSVNFTYICRMKSSQARIFFPSSRFFAMGKSYWSLPVYIKNDNRYLKGDNYRFFEPYLSSGFGLPLNTYAVVIDSGVAYSYCNGVRCSNTINPQEEVLEEDTWYIDSYYSIPHNGDTWTFDKNATYGNLMVYNRALTADEIAYNYNIDKLRFNLPTT